MHYPIWVVFLIFAATYPILWFSKRLLKVRRAWQMCRDCPGDTTLLLEPTTAFAISFGRFWPRPGKVGHYMRDRIKDYYKYGSTVFVIVQFFTGTHAYWIADPDAIKAVANNRASWDKDVIHYEPFNVYGPNIVGSAGQEWKKHRSVAKISFPESTNVLVWSETIRVMNEMFQALDSSRGSDFVMDLLKDMTQATLLVVCSASFGRRLSWGQVNHKSPLGYRQSFQSNVTEAMDRMLLRMIIPPWLWSVGRTVHIPKLSSFLKETGEVYEMLRGHILEMIAQAKSWTSLNKGAKNTTNGGLLRTLVESNTEGVGDGGLTDQELLSDIYTFLLAGHETSAHTLCLAFVHLALYPDIQRKAFEEVKALWPDGVPSSSSTCKESLARLEYVTAVFHEVLRHFPVVPRIGKLAYRESSIKARRFKPFDGRQDKPTMAETEEFRINVPSGSYAVYDITAIQMNPLYWGRDAEQFRPERFIDTDTYRWPRDAFIAFSAGLRSCLGQHFAITESTCVIASLLRRYEILVLEALEGKSFEEQKETLTKWIPGVTIIPTGAHVRLRKRRD